MSSTLANDRSLKPTELRKGPVADRWYSEKRLGGLSRFALAITLLNVVGHLFLGFEQSWLTPFVSLATAYGTELIGETIGARINGRPARYSGSFVNLVKFLLPAHISGLAIGMLLYAAENVAAIAFRRGSCDGVQICVPRRRRYRRRWTAAVSPRPQSFEFGISVTLLLFPTVGIAPPYQFTENTSGVVDWILPLIIICTGSYLNTKADGRIP